MTESRIRSIKMVRHLDGVCAPKRDVFGFGVKNPDGSPRFILRVCETLHRKINVPMIRDGKVMTALIELNRSVNSGKI